MGSVILSLETERTILSYIEAGAYDYVAAEAAGIDARTFRDWIARGEGRHPTRRITPRLKAFATRVREAKARARVRNEVETAKIDPKFWLTHVARSKPGREGWTDPVADPIAESAGPPAYQPTQDELAEILHTLVEAGALDLSPCGDPDCACVHHAKVADG